MRTGFDIRTDVVLDHCCHCYDNLGLITLSWAKDTRSCSSQGQSDYLRSSFSTEKEYSNLSSKIRKVDCNTNSTIVFNLGALRPVTRVLLVSCTSPGAGKWVVKRVKNWVDLLSKNRLSSILQNRTKPPHILLFEHLHLMSPCCCGLLVHKKGRWW